MPFVSATDVNSTAASTIAVSTAATLTISGTASTLNGVISGTGSLTKGGAGTLIIAGNNTYTGSTSVNGGTLRVDGALSSPIVNINNGGRLGGGGAVNTVAVDAGGVLFPGDTGHKITIGSLLMASKSTLAVNLNGTGPGTSYDQVEVHGIANLDTDAGTSSTLDVNVNFNAMAGDTFTIIDNDGDDTIMGTFAGPPEGSTVYADGYAFRISYRGGADNNDVTLTTLVRPQVVSVTPNGNITNLSVLQGSNIVSLVIAFDQPVQFDANAVSLALHTNGVTFGGVAQPSGFGTLPNSLSVAAAADNKWIVTFLGNTDGSGGLQSLKDGVYDFQIDAAMIHPLGEPRVNLTPFPTTTIHRLFGDGDAPTGTPSGNGRTDFSSIVNTGDNLEFRDAFNRPPGGGYVAYFDFDGDGFINTGDNLEFRNRFNRTLTWRV